MSLSPGNSTRQLSASRDTIRIAVDDKSLRVKPGDVIELETTISDPTNTLLELELPRQGGLAQNDYRGESPSFDLF